jgi:hypothetical protein
LLRGIIWKRKISIDTHFFNLILEKTPQTTVQTVVFNSNILSGQYC